jgi:hypothetical protein
MATNVQERIEPRRYLPGTTVDHIGALYRVLAASLPDCFPAIW